MLQLLSNLWVTRAVGTFVRLGLADVMEQGAEDAAAIAAARGLVPDRVYRLLRALSTVGIVTEPVRGRFALTPLGRLLSSHSRRQHPDAAIFLNDYFADMWTHLDEALADDGTAFEALKGRPFFDWLRESPEEARRFNRMMLEVHGPETPAIVAAYDFGSFEHIVDIGGGNGSLLSAVLAAYPKRRATLFEWRKAIAAAKRGEGGPLPGVALRYRRRVRDAGARRAATSISSAISCTTTTTPNAFAFSSRAARHAAGRAGAGAGGADCPIDDRPGPAAGSICK